MIALSTVIVLSGMPLWMKFINFAIFVAGMGYVLYKPLSDGLKSRAKAIEDDLQKAARERAAAEVKMKELDERLSNLDREIAEIKAQAERDAEAERDRILKSAKEDAERLRAMARLEIEGAFKAARTELRAFAASQAVELAEQLIRREMKDEDGARLVKNYIDHFERVN